MAVNQGQIWGADNFETSKKGETPFLFLLQARISIGERFISVAGATKIFILIALIFLFIVHVAQGTFSVNSTAILCVHWVNY
jgi:hypothetical protein